MTIIVISVLAFAFTGFLTWIFWKYYLSVAFCLALFAMAFEMIAAMIGALHMIDNYACEQVAEKMGVEHDYSPLNGCFIKDENGRWYNYEQQRVIK